MGVCVCLGEGGLSVHPCVPVLIMHITSASTWCIYKEMQVHFYILAHCACAPLRALSANMCVWVGVKG